jgi:hypothetical protein
LVPSLSQVGGFIIVIGASLTAFTLLFLVNRRQKQESML